MKLRIITKAVTALAALWLPASADTITYNFSTGLQGWTQIWPSPGNGSVWGGGTATPR